MSPGVTFERVYHELKRMLARGEFPPGTPIEPVVIGKLIATSITPVRDALHRLTGERLVEAPNHNGFRAPLPTEAALRELYEWRGLLLSLAAHRTRSSSGKYAPSPAQAPDTSSATASLFLEVARASNNVELAAAVQQANDRLAPFHRAEYRIFADLADEYGLLVLQYDNARHPDLVRLLRQYHQRRIRAVSHLLAQSVHAAERSL